MSTKTTWAGVAHSSLMVLLGGVIGFGTADYLKKRDSGAAHPSPEPSLAPEKAVPQPLPDQVQLLRVVDGDTIYVQVGGQELKLRMLRINTPERGKPGYKEATDALRKLLAGKTLRLEYEVKGTVKKDRYGRDLVYVFAKDARGEINVNLEMVKSGWTGFYRKYGEGRLRELFDEAEKSAKEELKGLWQR